MNNNSCKNCEFFLPSKNEGGINQCDIDMNFGQEPDDICTQWKKAEAI